MNSTFAEENRVVSCDLIKFSVIMPVYNAEIWLDWGILCMLGQSYTNWELICVDDGSSDSSAEILKKYAAFDSRIKYVYQQNSGVSTARNTGIKMASGEYILFLDADDYFDDDALYFINETVKSTSCDFAVMALREVAADDRKKHDSHRTGALKQMPLTSDSLGCCTWYVTDKIFRRDIIKQYDVFYAPEIHMCEDFHFWFRYAIYCNDVVFIDDVLYNHQLTPGSLSGTFYKKWERLPEEHVRISLSISQHLLDFCKSIQDKKKRREFSINLLYRSTTLYVLLLRTIKKLNNPLRRVGKKYLKFPIFDFWKEVPFKSFTNAVWQLISSLNGMLMNKIAKVIRRH